MRLQIGLIEETKNDGYGVVKTKIGTPFSL